jgi:transposase
MIRLNTSDWERIRHDFPKENISQGRPGRKPVPTRKILEAALWILNTRAQWHMLPQCYPRITKPCTAGSRLGAKPISVGDGCLQMLNLCPNRSNAFAMSMVTGRRTVAQRLVPGRGRPREKGPRRAAAPVRLCSIRQEEAGPANPWPTRRKGHDAFREYCRLHAE